MPNWKSLDPFGSPSLAYRRPILFISQAARQHAFFSLNPHFSPPDLKAKEEAVPSSQKTAFHEIIKITIYLMITYSTYARYNMHARPCSIFGRRYTKKVGTGLLPTFSGLLKNKIQGIT